MVTEQVSCDWCNRITGEVNNSFCLIIRCIKCNKPFYARNKADWEHLKGVKELAPVVATDPKVSA